VLETQRDPTGPSLPTVKRLFAHSGNRCAFPRCPEVLVQGSTVVGKICHIKAANAKGPRYDPQQTAAERHGYDNLLLLCGKHHTVIDDDEEAYTVERVIKMKTDHESRAPRVDDDFAETAARHLIDQSVTTVNQSGGITAHTIHTINVNPLSVPDNETEEKTSLLREHWEVTAITLIARYLGRHEPDEVTIPCQSLSQFDAEVKTEYAGGIPQYSWVVTNAYILASGIDLTGMRQLTWRPTKIVFKDSQTGEQKGFFLIGMDIISQSDTAKFFINS
jgi:hypothetical protein